MRSAVKNPIIKSIARTELTVFALTLVLREHQASRRLAVVNAANEKNFQGCFLLHSCPL